jgi:excinuclease ABC subunit A
MNIDKITIEGAREHNLKNINVEIPRNSLTVITGLSGSGKSTLAFDTLYAEGQRRYVESLSSYARQFLGQMDKPDVDAITGLSPAISIEQKTASHNPRSTVGTITEIFDYLRLLFTRVGKPHCHICGRPISSQTIDQMVDKVLSMEEQSRIIILAPIVKGKKGSHKKLLAHCKKDGFARVRVNDKIQGIDELPVLEKNQKHTIDIVVDRLIIKDGIRKRLADSMELALSISKTHIIVLDLIKKQEHLFSETACCIECDISYPELTPASFSFNSPHGACKKCSGLGAVTQFDPDLIVPDKELSLRQGAVVPWEGRNSVQFMEFLDALVTHYKENIYTPFKDLSLNFQQALLYGSGKEEINFYIEKMDKKIIYKRPFEGIIPGLEKRLHESGASYIKDDIKKFMNYKTCSACHGSRLNPASSAVKLGAKTIWEISALSIEDACRFISCLRLSDRDQMIADSIVKELVQRLSFLQNVGLDYLTLDRSAATLSGGESQRIRLATQIGSKLTGVLYVLDEPSIGLHQKDNNRLLTTLINLRDLGNTVLIVEHDEDTIRYADHIIDIGPGAGINGGQVMFSGTPENLEKNETSLTGLYLSGKKKISVPEKRRKGNGSNLSVYKAQSNNLKHIDVHFPLGCFTCVTGVSGSGKSTLVLSTLYRILANRLYHSKKKAGLHESITGLEHIDKVIHIDQSPIGKTPRSNPGTYTQVFNHIRDLFASTREAKARGYKPGRFSFNVKGGRCEACSGDGIIKIEMHFLPDVYVICDVCKGRRYNSETLDITYKGKNIAQVLNMTINQAVRFFENISFIKTKLDTLIEVGLGYIKLGQPATTLSGGEAQRIKLSRELSKKETGKTIYILDEPTTGLHWDDIKKLLFVLNKLVDTGNTVIVIEHNLDVIKCADHIIDLGPEGGDKGGRIIAEGTPEQITQNKKSYTGFYLKKVLEGN